MKTLESNFEFDKSRQRTISQRLKKDGPDGLLVRNPVTLFTNSEGYCADSAYFALETLNKINPSYEAGWIFILNGKNAPNHWVTGFNVGDKLCIIEAMKTFNEIEAEVSGKIVKVLVDDASPVDYEQPLFLVEPA